MMTSPHFRIAAVMGLAMILPPAIAQKGGSGATKGGNPGANPPGFSTNSTSSPSRPATVYIWGSVRLEDGGAPPEPVAVERICGGSTRREGYTDFKGQFGFQLGQSLNSEVQDVTDTDTGSFHSGRPGGSSQGNTRNSLVGCELRASLPGFQSSTVLLRPDGDSEQLQVGTIVLKRMGSVAGTTISLTTMMAPNDAKRAFEKAQKDMQQNKTEAAEKELNKAVQIYPHFAAAWSLLGEIHENQKQIEQAKTEYAQAAANDSQFVTPYFRLAAIAVQEKKWQDAVRFTDQIDKLNPFAFPMASFYNAASNYYLGNMDAAEKSARKFASLDTSHQRPDVSLLLGDILARKHDYAGAAQQMREYLSVTPGAPNAERIRAEAKRMEDLSATTAAAKPQ